MWKKLFDTVWRVLRLTDTTQKNSDEIKSLWQKVDDLTDAMQRIAFEMQRISEREQHEREKLELQVKHEFEKRAYELEKRELQAQLDHLRAERVLPPAKTKDESE